MSQTAYQRPLLIVAERTANPKFTEQQKSEGTKGVYFCKRCDHEVVLTAPSLPRIMSSPHSNLLCVDCVKRDPALVWKFVMKKIAG